MLYNRNVALNVYFARRYDELIQQCQKTLELPARRDLAPS